MVDLDPALTGQENLITEEPSDVVDRLLWRNAREVLARHDSADRSGMCVWCGLTWPCPPHKLAERAEAAAFRPWDD